MGARKYDRIGPILKNCILLVTLVGGIMGLVGCAFRNELINIYANGDPDVVFWGAQRMIIVSAPYFIFGISDTIVGVVRGMGNSTLPMIISIFGVCAFRILWLYTAFAMEPTFEMLMIGYPVSWVVTMLGQGICYLVMKKKIIARCEAKFAV